MDYYAFCKNYSLVTGIPVTLMEGQKALYTSMGEELSLDPSKTWVVFWEDPHVIGNPLFCSSNPDIEYGAVHIEGTSLYVILGPAFSIPLTENLVQAYIREHAIPLAHREAVADYLHEIPRLTHLQFARHLGVLYTALNQKDVDWDAFLNWDRANEEKRWEKQFEKQFQNTEEPLFHATWQYEQQLYRLINEGNTLALEQFLSVSQFPEEGRLAATPLRHTKNLFIQIAAKTGLMAAIRGGMDPVQTYQLIEMYTQECEKLQTQDSVHALLVSMLRDFSRRAGAVKIPQGISKETYACICYIREHTHEPVTVNSVADHIHRSRSYTSQIFRQELGITIGAFITRCKLEDAKSLLRHSQKSLSEISNYLCFSSQSYFQNVFKKKYGITPLQYRKNSGHNESTSM